MTLSACRAWAVLATIIVVYLGLSYLYATRIPKWNAPDEPAHFNYVRFVATTGGLPVLMPGDYDPVAVEERMAAKFPDRLPVDWMRYESHQPPLYYALAAPVYRLVAGRPLGTQVVALRLFSSLIGACGLVVAYLAARQIFPRDLVLALAVPGVMAFIPMRVALFAAVENDALAELVLSSVLLCLLVGLRRLTGWRYDVLVGLLLGAALLTKMVDYVSVGLIGVAFAAAELLPSPFLPSGRPIVARLGRLARRLAVVYGIGALLTAWWFARNIGLYGWPDVFGMRRHDLVVAGQPLTGAITWAVAERFVLTCFHSFWAQFGWMGINADDRTYRLLGWLTYAALVGLVLYAVWLLRNREALSSYERRALGLLVLAAAFVSAGVVYYNLTYLQPQGRYLFPALVPLVLLPLLGPNLALVRLRANAALAILPMGLAGFSLYCLFRFIVPYFAG